MPVFLNEIALGNELDRLLIALCSSGGEPAPVPEGKAEPEAERRPFSRNSRTDQDRERCRGAGKFGLTPVARSRLAAGVGAQPLGKFDGFIGDT